MREEAKRIISALSICQNCRCVYRESYKRDKDEVLSEFNLLSERDGCTKRLFTSASWALLDTAVTMCLFAFLFGNALCSASDSCISLSLTLFCKKDKRNLKATFLFIYLLFFCSYRSVTPSKT